MSNNGVKKNKQNILLLDLSVVSAYASTHIYTI